MKFFQKLILISLLAIAVAVPVAGCNTNDVVVIEQEVEPTEATKYSSIEEYVKSEEMQQIEKQLNQENDGNLTIKLKADDNKLVYEYTMVNDIGENMEAVKSSLEQQLKDGEETSKIVANSLKNYVEVEEPSIVIRYYTNDGTLITQQEYKTNSEKTVPVQEATEFAS